ncbi:MAG: type 4a pilus biogenesis protein PilO [Deltaproteobacteria bacterium]|nr:type 4a pilus biogenesis protein PilO [Deltaproteobacteria bacterium]
MKIGRREMALLFFGGFLVMVLLYYLIILSPAVSKEKSLIKRIHKKTADLAQVIELKSQWEKFKDSKTKTEKTLTARGKTFSLLSFLEGVSREVGIDDKIQYMKPLAFHDESSPMKPAGIEMNLDNINMEQLVTLLYKIEGAGKLLNITRIKIQRASVKKTRTLKVTLQVNTYTFS